MTSSRLQVLVVGAGVVGTTIAVEAADAGHHVTIVDEGRKPAAPSRLNLGLIRVSGRRLGREMELAMSGRARWEILGRRIPEIGFRPTGSLVVLENDEEIAFAEEYLAAVQDILSLEIVPGSKISDIEPAILGSFAAALMVHDDAWIRPGRAANALLDYLEAHEGTAVERGTRMLGLRSSEHGAVVDTSHGPIAADRVFICTGEAAFAHAGSIPNIHPRRLHTTMGRSVTVPQMIVADASTFRMHAGFRDTGDLGVRDDQPGHHLAEWITSPTTGGSLIVGVINTTDLGVPLPLDDAILQWLERRTSAIFGIAPAAARPRTFSARVIESDGHPYVAFDVDGSTTVVTGHGQRGNTIAPAVARELVAGLM